MLFLLTVDQFLDVNEVHQGQIVVLLSASGNDNHILETFEVKSVNNLD